MKRLHPDRPISFGGLSSTIFHEDLIAYDCVDYVFRGDSTEEPMRMLVERIKRADETHTPLGDLSDIPNLTWKDSEGSVHINPLSWVPDDMDAISLDYAYPMKGVLRHHDMTSFLPMKGWLKYPVTASLTCRGCSRNCATCGGSAYTFKNHFGRRSVAWRSPELLIRDIENVQKHVWGPIFVLNDFLQAGPEYTQQFIEGLNGKVHNPIGFEFFGPPPGGNDFYTMLDKNLKSWSVEISAESHDDDVRKAFGKGFDNADILEARDDFRGRQIVRNVEFGKREVEQAIFRRVEMNLGEIFCADGFERFFGVARVIGQNDDHVEDIIHVGDDDGLIALFDRFIIFEIIDEVHEIDEDFFSGTAYEAFLLGL
jgi:hypothetical protein